MAPIPEDCWDAWSPNQLAERMRGVSCEWYVVGGWALDLWQGRQSRPQDDLEFAVRPEHALTVMHHLGDLAFYAAQAAGLAVLGGGSGRWLLAGRYDDRTRHVSRLVL